MSLVKNTVTALLKKEKEGSRPKGSLGTCKLEEFNGSKLRYKRWKKITKAQADLYQLSEKESALLIYLATTGEARETVDVLEVDELTDAAGLQTLWALLDDAYEKEEAERLDEAEESYIEALQDRVPGAGT